MTPLKSNIQRKIEEELNIHIEKVIEINEGMNNQLFKLIDTQNKKYLLKQYLKDDRNRLWREFHAIRFLRDHNFKNIPQAIWECSDQQVAVYSFEEGSTKSGSQITQADITKMADFLAQLHMLLPKDIPIQFPPAVMACFSINDYIKNIDFRVGRFVEHLKNPHTLIGQKFKTETIRDLFKRLQKKALADLSTTEVSAILPLKSHRLSPVDFGPHNILIDNKGHECFIDFEYFGFDDPARVIADFQMHDRSSSIDKSLRDFFRERYLDSIKASKKFIQYLSLVEAIIAIEWLSIYLWSITPEKLENRKFSDPYFDEEKYIDTQIKKFESRLEAILQ